MCRRNDCSESGESIEVGLCLRTGGSGNTQLLETGSSQVCTETFGAAPEVVIGGSSAQLATMPYIPTHLDYMLYELLKNAMRAVVERHRGRALPPLHVAICKAQSSVTLRIADQGGGIPDDQLDKVFQYGFTTVGAQDSTVPVSAGPL